MLGRIGGARMKLLVSALLLAFSSTLLAQNRTPPPPGPAGVLSLDLQASPVLGPDNQAGCPVVLTGARLTDSSKAGLFPVASGDVPVARLDLRFQNASGKPIRSVEVTIHLTGKTNKYQLDATSFVFHLTFSGTDAVDRAAEQLRQLQLPQEMYPYGVNGVSLERVSFSDGSAWTAGPQTNCRFHANSELIGAK
jgi:hypothetical protein